ncbi:MAG: carboxypeptidase regulatory-like domain-containing protein, partial [Flavobacteriales bacterium]|nr:carboxypeptidase regulatory-like domain-containing protein [Flavobacteriales bacterium]
ASSLGAGVHTATVTDANGCTASDSATIIEPAVLTASISASTNVSCNGGNDGSATVAETGGTGPYNYAWTPSGAITATASTLAAGVHTATVTDANGCTASDSATITEPAVLSATITSTDATCGNADGTASVTAVGGTGPFAYLWDDPLAQTNATAIGLAGGGYVATISDANGCSTTANTTILSNNIDAVISGTVSINGVPVTAGLVAMLTYNSNPNMMTVAATTTIDNSGGYTFTGIIPDDYLVIAEADSSLYSNVVPTFHDSTNHWQQATIVTAACNDTITNINIGLIDFPTIIAFGSISGKIQKGGPGKTGYIGIPFPGVDISLEESPGGTVKGSTTTNDSGYYEFNNVEEGQYVLYINIPGLEMDSTYTINITVASGDTIFPDLNFHIDTTIGAGMIFVDTTAILIGIVDYFGSDNKLFAVYPNPFREFTTIEYTLIEKGYVTMELYNTIGEKIKTLYQGEKLAGDFKYRLNLKDAGHSSGIYFVKLSLNNKVQVQRIIGLD